MTFDLKIILKGTFTHDPTEMTIRSDAVLISTHGEHTSVENTGTCEGVISTRSEVVKVHSSFVPSASRRIGNQKG